MSYHQPAAEQHCPPPGAGLPRHIMPTLAPHVPLVVTTRVDGEPAADRLLCPKTVTTNRVKEVMIVRHFMVEDGD